MLALFLYSRFKDQDAKQKCIKFGKGYYNELLAVGNGLTTKDLILG